MANPCDNDIDLRDRGLQKGAKRRRNVKPNEESTESISDISNHNLARSSAARRDRHRLERDFEKDAYLQHIAQQKEIKKHKNIVIQREQGTERSMSSLSTKLADSIADHIARQREIDKSMGVVFPSDQVAERIMNDVCRNPADTEGRMRDRIKASSVDTAVDVRNKCHLSKDQRRMRSPSYQLTKRNSDVTPSELIESNAIMMGNVRIEDVDHRNKRQRMHDSNIGMANQIPETSVGIDDWLYGESTEIYDKTNIVPLDYSEEDLDFRVKSQQRTQGWSKTKTGPDYQITMGKSDVEHRELAKNINIVKDNNAPVVRFDKYGNLRNMTLHRGNREQKNTVNHSDHISDEMGNSVCSELTGTMDCDKDRDLRGRWVIGQSRQGISHEKVAEASNTMTNAQLKVMSHYKDVQLDLRNVSESLQGKIDQNSGRVHQSHQTQTRKADSTDRDLVELCFKDVDFRNTSLQRKESCNSSVKQTDQTTGKCDNTCREVGETSSSITKDKPVQVKGLDKNTDVSQKALQNDSDCNTGMEEAVFQILQKNDDIIHDLKKICDMTVQSYMELDVENKLLEGTRKCTEDKGRVGCSLQISREGGDISTSAQAVQVEPDDIVVDLKSTSLPKESGYSRSSVNQSDQYTPIVKERQIALKHFNAAIDQKSKALQASRDMTTKCHMDLDLRNASLDKWRAWIKDRSTVDHNLQIPSKSSNISACAQAVQAEPDDIGEDLKSTSPSRESGHSRSSVDQSDQLTPILKDEQMALEHFDTDTDLINKALQGDSKGMNAQSGVLADRMMKDGKKDGHSRSSVDQSDQLSPILKDEQMALEPFDPDTDLRNKSLQGDSKGMNAQSGVLADRMMKDSKKREHSPDSECGPNIFMGETIEERPCLQVDENSAISNPLTNTGLREFLVAVKEKEDIIDSCQYKATKSYLPVVESSKRSVSDTEDWTSTKFEDVTFKRTAAMSVNKSNLLQIPLGIDREACVNPCVGPRLDQTKLMDPQKLPPHFLPWINNLSTYLVLQRIPQPTQSASGLLSSLGKAVEKCSGVMLVQAENNVSHSACIAFETRAKCVLAKTILMQGRITSNLSDFLSISDKWDIRLSTSCGRDWWVSPIERMQLLNAFTETQQLHENKPHVPHSSTWCYEFIFAKRDNKDECYLQLWNLPAKVTACGIWTSFGGANGRTHGVVLVRMLRSSAVAFVMFSNKKDRAQLKAQHPFSKELYPDEVKEFLLSLDDDTKIFMSTMSRCDLTVTSSMRANLVEPKGNSDSSVCLLGKDIVVGDIVAKSIFSKPWSDSKMTYIVLRGLTLPTKITSSEIWSWFGGKQGKALGVLLALDDKENVIFASVAYRTFFRSISYHTEWPSSSDPVNGARVTMYPDADVDAYNISNPNNNFRFQVSTDHVKDHFLTSDEISQFKKDVDAQRIQIGKHMKVIALLYPKEMGSKVAKAEPQLSPTLLPNVMGKTASPITPLHKVARRKDSPSTISSMLGTKGAGSSVNHQSEPLGLTETKGSPISLPYRNWGIQRFYPWIARDMIYRVIRGSTLPPKIKPSEIWTWFGGSTGLSSGVLLVREFGGQPLLASVAYQMSRLDDVRLTDWPASDDPVKGARVTAQADAHLVGMSHKCLTYVVCTELVTDQLLTLQEAERFRDSLDAPQWRSYVEFAAITSRQQQNGSDKSTANVTSHSPHNENITTMSTSSPHYDSSNRMITKVGSQRPCHTPIRTRQAAIAASTSRSNLVQVPSESHETEPLQPIQLEKKQSFKKIKLNLKC